ncbi:MAG: cytochrome c-type biogenesis CcmF C-terminal domain-containing protein, partial [Thermoleophilia bacterium]|nr:cytochrome c-type biogenesis CcmF C-terminal domain-containing protein [Thermoleophilia bacterium]
RMPLLESESELDSLVSRESSFLLNNVLLVGAALAVFLGTMFPVISEAFRGTKVTVNEVIAGINRILGKNVKPTYAPRRAGDVMHSHADISLARKVLGYEPVVPFEEGLKRTVEFFMARSPQDRL